MFDAHDQAQLWVGDPTTDARAYLGRVRVIAGAAITVPVASLPRSAPQTSMPSDSRLEQAWAAAQTALVWAGGASHSRDARWRRNAWCVVSVVVVLLAGAEHPALVLREGPAARSSRPPLAL